MIIVWILIVLAFLLILVYNSLITSRNRVNEAWSDIEVQLKRRHDLIPNLVNTVKGYASHEQNVLTEVTEARTRAENAASPLQKQAAEGDLSRALANVFAVAENYPQLRANENFLRLQADLTDTEDKIQAARRFYNGNVRDYNTKLQKFPTNMIAGILRFTSRDFFDATDEETATPEVKF